MHKIKTFITPMVATTLLLCTAPIFAAITPGGGGISPYGGISQAINNLTKTVTQIATATATQAAKYLFDTSSSQYTAGAMSANSAAANDVETQTQTEVSNLSSQMVSTLIGMHDSGTVYAEYATLCGSDYPDTQTSCLNASTSLFGGTKAPPVGNDQQYENLSFNATTLLGTPTYNTAQQTLAQNYLAFVTGNATPYEIFATSNYQTLFSQGKLADPEQQKYRAIMRSYVSQLSLAANNLYYVYALHMPITGLGTKAGIPGKTDVSSDELDQYMATRRVGNPQWYASMDTASSATVNREILYVLAEMRYELYQQRMMQERLLATAATGLSQQIWREQIAFRSYKPQQPPPSSTNPAQQPPQG